MSSATDPKTILIRGDGDSREAIAAGTILPGHLISLDTAGKVVVHPTAGGVAPSRYFAREEEFTDANLDTAYSSGDSVTYWSCKPGDQVYALVAAAAPAIVIGDLLESAGDGTLRKVTSYLTDNSGGTGNTTLQDISSSPAEAEVANNDADLAAAINALKGGATGVARAVQAVDNSGGASVARIIVEVL
jgi:hypothetical protein